MVLAVLLLAVGLHREGALRRAVARAGDQHPRASWRARPCSASRGAKTYQTDGQLDLTTVSVRDKLTLFEALSGWVSGRKAVIPREFVYPDDQSSKQNEAETKAEMTSSQTTPTDAALTELGLARVKVAERHRRAAAPTGKLKAGDVIVAVDGVKVFGPGPAARRGAQAPRSATC